VPPPVATPSVVAGPHLHQRAALLRARGSPCWYIRAGANATPKRPRRRAAAAAAGRKRRRRTSAVMRTFERAAPPQVKLT